MGAAAPQGDAGVVARLREWEDAGAGWRLHELTGDRAVVDLLTCTGEPVDRLETDDPAALDYLRERPASDR